MDRDHDDFLFQPEHLRHCVEHLRQHVMCHADITPMVRQWDEERRRNRIRVDTLHTCRNFEKIRSWALRQGLYEKYLAENENWMDSSLVVDGFRLQGR